MYNNNSSYPSRDRNNSGYSRNSNNSGRGGNSGGGNFRRGGGSSFSNGPRRSKFKAQRIDPSLFIKKATQVEKEIYIPKNKFSDFEVNTLLKTNIERKGYINPTPIQDQTIPLILQGKDILGIANTGTGKTAAFLIPLIDKVLRDRRQKVLIIIPTRELAVQIKDEFMTFIQGSNLQAALCIGGADIRRQMMNIKRGAEFVVATPGRLKDLMMRRAINLNDYNNIVLDEVDRMLDMGFYPEIKMLIEQMPAQKQSLFFSATLESKGETIANNFLVNPEKIVVKTQETAANVHQDIVMVDASKKVDKLDELLKQEDFKKVLIFTKTKRGAEKLQQELLKRGHKVESIHGDKSQFQRQKALDSFKRNSAEALIATDVVARGIDISDISHVINFDVPNTFEDYVHRIGRTGRGDKSGIALTFVER